MRMTEERIRQIQMRTAELRRENAKRKRRMLGTALAALCLAAIVFLGAWMPGVMARADSGGVSHVSGAASLIGSHSALGYILMGLLSFLLGVCVTVLLYRLRNRNEHGSHGTNDGKF